MSRCEKINSLSPCAALRSLIVQRIQSNSIESLEFSIIPNLRIRLRGMPWGGAGGEGGLVVPAACLRVLRVLGDAFNDNHVV